MDDPRLWVIIWRRIILEIGLNPRRISRFSYVIVPLLTRENSIDALKLASTLVETEVD